jgi:NAD(P)-dependent dehydrogenase (short-subunit alcohol dehydrogenase family)
MKDVAEYIHVDQWSTSIHFWQPQLDDREVYMALSPWLVQPNDPSLFSNHNGGLTVSNALQNRTAVILGGTSGMGLASAKRFLAEGARVIITGRKKEKIDAAQQELQGDFAIYQADIADYEATKSAIEQGVERFGKIDVFYQVAGIAAMVPFEMADAAHYETMINVDLVSPIVALLNARPHLNDGASIILTTTTAATRPAPPATAYAAAKAGLDQFAKVLALELANRKIRVNVISPGPIDTPILNEMGMPEEQVSGFKQFLTTIIPLGRLGRDDEIANAALFLASDESSFISGVTLQVDGGLNQSFHQMPG